MSIFDLLPDDKKLQPVMYGVMVAQVTDNKDPDKLGRVKCKFIAREKQETTDWIRVATLMTGKEMGSFFLPEVDDEVLLAFANGELSKPYVIGSLWNKKEKPPKDNADGKNNIRLIKTRSGSELNFNDEDKKAKITLKTPGDRILLQDDENQVTDIHDKDSKNGVKIESKNGQITIKAEKKIILKAGQCSIELDGNANSITIKSGATIKISGQQINVESGGTAEIKASGMLDVKSDAILNIKGSMVKIN